MSDIAVWRTNSNIRWTFVSAETLGAALVQMARVLVDFEMEGRVTHLQLDIDDEGMVIVGALSEKGWNE